MQETEFRLVDITVTDRHNEGTTTIAQAEYEGVDVAQEIVVAAVAHDILRGEPGEPLGPAVPVGDPPASVHEVHAIGEVVEDLLTERGPCDAVRPRGSGNAHRA